MRKNKNKVHLEGFLYEHNLEVKVSGPTSKVPNTTFISGTISIATDDECVNIVPVHFTYVAATTSKGGPNATFNTLKNIHDGIFGSVMGVGKENAVKLVVDSALALNEFYAERNGVEELVSSKRAEGGFVHKVDVVSEDPSLRNYFEVDMVITNAVRKEADEEKIWNAVSVVAEDALNGFVAMREREGARLKADVLSRLDEIIGNVEFIEVRSPQTVAEYNEKLLGRLRELLADTHIDEQRILTEAAIFAEKIAVDEETVPLRSHISQLRELVNSDETIGRKLDFIVQEMNRETNTIGSKSQNVEIAHIVVAIKSEIEKIREQIQNIE